MLDEIRKVKSNVLLVGDRLSLVSTLRVDTKESKEILFLNSYSFGIDDARALQSIVSKNESNNKLIVISFFVISLEAQNAMLKTLEDYIQYQFVFIVENANTLIPTVRSRLVLAPHPITTLQVLESGATSKFIQSFLKMSSSDRLKNKDIQAMIEKRIDINDDKSAKAKDDTYAFIVAITSELLNIYRQGGGATLPGIINELNSLAHYVLKNGSSQKLIIEYICYRVSI